MSERGIPWDDATCPWIVVLPLAGGSIGIEPERYVCQKSLPCPDHRADGAASHGPGCVLCAAGQSATDHALGDS